jgi:translation initiation factor IF-1
VTGRNDLFEIKGTVTEALPNMMYRATITEGPEQLIGRVVLCTVNGNMRRFNIRVLPGDGIIAEMTVYDLQKARITRRLREGGPDVQIEQPVAEVSKTEPSPEGDAEVSEVPVDEALESIKEEA